MIPEPKDSPMAWPPCIVPLSAPVTDFLDDRITAWITTDLASSEHFIAVDRPGPGELPEAMRRWYIRLRGDTKSFITVWLTLNQRTLAYETYMLPAPEENVAEAYEYVLKRNTQFTGAQFGIGDENALYLTGSLPLPAIWAEQLPDVLDQIIGTLWAYVERSFTDVLHIGWASRFK